jgi:IS5 family transposase
MLRLRDGQTTLWDETFPPGVGELSPELAAIDALLAEDRFLEPFRRRLASKIGRPTVPIETYIRLMYLKHRYGMGYETLVKEVADSISWRRFCRIALGGEVPHATTLIKLTQRCGPEIFEELNQTLLRTAVERKLLRSRRLRVDTTVMEADVRYPTDSGLCAHAVSRLTRTVTKIKTVGLAARTTFRDRRRRAAKVVRRVSHALGRAGSKNKVLQCTKELQELAATVTLEARSVFVHAQRTLRNGRRRGAHLVDRLDVELGRAERVIAQTLRRLAGEISIPDRLISLADPDARPIRRGRYPDPNEFGYKVALADTPEGFVVSHQVYVGAPHDTDTLRPALQAALDTGMQVTTVYGDRGYGNEEADGILDDLGIRDAVIPRVGQAAPCERTRGWKRRYRWRAGCEGRISHCKRRFGLRRTRLKGYEGARIWAGAGFFAHNVDKLVALA